MCADSSLMNYKEENYMEEHPPYQILYLGERYRLVQNTYFFL